MPAIALLGGQWGDEGKGKYTDILSASADFTVRFQGGNNAGHTIVGPGPDSAPLRLHLVPSCIRRPGCVPVIGNGVACDPEVLIAELAGLRHAGFDPSSLKISGNAHLIMPYHKILDRVSERYLGSNRIGTTKKGIGPAYADKAARIGLRVQDLLDKKILLEKLETVLKERNQHLAKVYNQLPLDPSDIADRYESYGKVLEPHICDTSALLSEALAEGKTVLLEGAQGTLLDIDHGTYPFVTSSSCTAGGALTGSGIAPRYLEKVVGVIKAYVTRVGSGPFPTEADAASQAKLVELGGEYGTTTGRTRRCGWYDAVAAAYAARINGFDEVHLTKVDVLSAFASIPVAVAYEIEGKKTYSFPSNQSELHHAKPVYRELEGWQRDISTVRKPGDLPIEVMRLVEFVEESVGCPVRSISVGPSEDATVWLDA
jgi:adenylosuccinate synthase